MRIRCAGLLLYLLICALNSCGGRTGVGDAVTILGSADAQAPPMDASASTCTEESGLYANGVCPDPTCIYPGEWCGGSYGTSVACPSSEAVPTCGSPIACFCEEFWSCQSLSQPECNPSCPPPSSVQPWGACDFVTDVTCPSTATYQGGNCSCFYDGLGTWNCT